MPSRNYLHAPTIAQLPSGDIVAAWYEGSGEEMADDVHIAASVYDGRSWGTSSVVADTPNVPDTNPILVQGGDGVTRIIWSIVLAND